MTDPVVLDEQTANDVARLKQLSDQAAEIKQASDEIKARLREHLHPGHRYTFGGVEVLDLGKLGHQFDAGLAETVVPAELLPLISTSKPDAAKARKILPAELYARCCTLKQAAVKPL